MKRADQTAEYYSLGSLSVSFYDELTSLDPGLNGDIAFYQRHMLPNARVLELGCGTGRVSLALAAKGFQIVGIDLSPAMIRLAQSKLRKLSPSARTNVQFLIEDMLNINLPIRFHTVLLPFYGFNHLPGRMARARALWRVAHHLVPGGQAIIHSLPAERLRAEPTTGSFGKPGLVVQFENIDSRLEVTWAERTINQVQRRTVQIVEYKHLRGDGFLIEQSRERLVYYWFDDGELERSAAKMGLSLRGTFTSFGASNGEERIYLFEKLGTATGPNPGSPP